MVRYKHFFVKKSKTLFYMNLSYVSQYCLLSCGEVLRDRQTDRQTMWRRMTVHGFNFGDVFQHSSCVFEIVHQCDVVNLCTLKSPHDLS